MQTNLKRGQAASRARSAVVIAASASAVAAFSFFVPNSALAACGASHPAGVHAASTGAGGVHTSTGIAAPSGAGGGGGGTLGCANGSSASTLKGLPTTASGKVVEPDVHAARPEPHTKAAPTQTASSAAHAHAVKPAHHS